MKPKPATKPAPAKPQRVRRPKYIITRNGIPCTLIAPEVPWKKSLGRVAVPTDLPPCDPYVFRREITADRVIKRTQALAIEIHNRAGLFPDWLRRQLPHLRTLFAEAKYKFVKQGGDEKPKAYGCDVEIEIRESAISVSTRQFHWRGTEAACRRKAMLQARAVRVVKVTPLDEETYIRAYGANRRM
ncbi:hypothetical protein OpiT1DRAFT_04006 [Opitutaceae bacterium TAV1]|nr:hypothetical protein OpiT1DRAFT_04006 [Opitutaceae bacterium TAV1]